MRKITQLALAAGVAITAGSAPAQASQLRAAVFDIELYDTSEEGAADGVRADQTVRLAQMTTQIRDKLKSVNVELVDVAPAKAELDTISSLRTCNTCVVKAAKTLGADVSVMGYVQKVSNLILNINIEIRDANSGELLRAGSTDIRGNTTESWTRGADYLMRNRILKTPLPEGPAR